MWILHFTSWIMLFWWVTIFHDRIRRIFLLKIINVSSVYLNILFYIHCSIVAENFTLKEQNVNELFWLMSTADITVVMARTAAIRKIGHSAAEPFLMRSHRQRRRRFSRVLNYTRQFYERACVRVCIRPVHNGKKGVQIPSIVF